MSASLVGSEMCIRDSATAASCAMTITNFLVSESKYCHSPKSARRDRSPQNCGAEREAIRAAQADAKHSASLQNQ
eukprot:10058034-Alexandrium_andersonii.AAC.1